MLENFFYRVCDFRADTVTGNKGDLRRFEPGYTQTWLKNVQCIYRRILSSAGQEQVRGNRGIATSVRTLLVTLAKSAARVVAGL